MDTSQLLNQAIDAAADLVLEQPIGLPPLPSSTSLCRTLGVGASTFHRLFGNTAQFHTEFLDWNNASAYDDHSLVLTDALTAAKAKDLPRLHEDFGFLGGTILATLYWTDFTAPAIPEAVLYPWLTNVSVQGPIAAETARGVGIEISALVGFLVAAGADEKLAAHMAPHIGTTLAASGLAVRIVTNSNGVHWPAPAQQTKLSTIVITFARTAAAIIEGYLARDADSAAIEDNASV